MNPAPADDESIGSEWNDLPIWDEALNRHHGFSVLTLSKNWHQDSAIHEVKIDIGRR